MNGGASIRVCHVAVADLWAGAEVQLRALMSQLRRIPGFEHTVILFNEGRLEQEIRDLGVDVKVFPEQRWDTCKLFRELIREFKIGRFEIIHTHKYKDTILAAPAARKAGVPYVVRTVHGLREPFHGLQSLKMNVYELIEHRIHKHCVDAIIAVSSQIQDKLERERVVGTIVCVKNGLDLDAFPSQIDRNRKRAEIGVAADACLIGAVGRLTPVKGLEYLLRAARILLSRQCRVQVAIVGDGSLRGALEQQARDLGIVGNIVFLGHREDTQELMFALDIFALPSLSEGIPMALLEAMAAGRAVVASRVGGIPEVIHDGVEGFLVEPRDVQGFADKCLQLIESPDLAGRVGHAARKRVEENFSARGMAQQVTALYGDLIRTRGDL